VAASVSLLPQAPWSRLRRRDHAVIRAAPPPMWRPADVAPPPLPGHHRGCGRAAAAEPSPAHCPWSVSHSRNIVAVAADAPLSPKRHRNGDHAAATTTAFRARLPLLRPFFYQAAAAAAQSGPGLVPPRLLDCLCCRASAAERTLRPSHAPRKHDAAAVKVVMQPQSRLRGDSPAVFATPSLRRAVLSPSCIWLMACVAALSLEEVDYRAEVELRARVLYFHGY